MKNKVMHLALAFVLAFFLYPLLQKFITIPDLYAYGVVAFSLCLLLG